MKNNFKRHLTDIPRVLLGVTFSISAIGKFIDKKDSVQFVEQISSQWVFLKNLDSELVFFITVVEITLGLLLLSKKQLFSAYLFSFLFLAFFTLVTGYLFLMDVSISSCGCFGAFGLSGGVQTTLIRNIILMCLTTIGYVIHLRNEQNN